MPPIVPPAPMKPKSRLPWAGANTSAITDQKIDTTNMLKIDVQMKNPRPIHNCWPSAPHRSSA
jgi:hypothetical protein